MLAEFILTFICGFLFAVGVAILLAVHLNKR